MPKIRKKYGAISEENAELMERQTQTGNGDFIGASVGWGSNNSNQLIQDP